MLFKKSLENPDFEISLIPDQTLNSHISNSVRGGFVTLTESLKHFDNIFTVKDQYQKQNLKENIYGFYLDVKMLYGSVMEKPLPIGQIREVLPFEIDGIISKLSDVSFNPINSQYGYWLLVDIERNSPTLQDLSDRYPFALVNENITKKHLSEFTLNLLGDKVKNCTFKRLIGHHCAKKNFFCQVHYFICI